MASDEKLWTVALIVQAQVRAPDPKEAIALAESSTYNWHDWRVVEPGIVLADDAPGTWVRPGL